jgi:UDP-N-acetylmuramoyl-tripeptide--D-alanyl-D-alanine ligase
MLFTTEWLADLFTENQGELQSTVSIEEVATDSRIKTNQSLFIPLVGDNFDGHDHVKQAIDHGAVAMIWNKDKQLPASIPVAFPVFYVEDTLIALQQLAMNYRNEVNPIVVGITGSNGKTTTKDLVASIVKTTYDTHYTNGNFNNHIGLPLTILGMTRGTEVLILEMGMSNRKEIERLAEIAKPDYAIITNIGESHIEFLGTRQAIAEAKLEVLHGLKEDGLLLIDGDEKLLEKIPHHNHVITCGYDVNNDVMIEQVEIGAKQTTFKLANDSEYTISLLGKHHAQNATYAISLGKQLNISIENIKKGLSTLQSTSMRFELLKGKNDVTIINDAYNASPTSMKAAIDVIKQMKNFNEKVLILGDIFELGKHSKTLHRSVASVIESPVTAVFTYGEDAKYIADEVMKHQPDIVCMHVTSIEDLLKNLQPYLNGQTILLFKASRGMKFETIIADVQKIYD